MLEYTPLKSTQQSGEYILYTRRWYILFLFGLLSATQSNLWISYGAVAETTQELYNTSSSYVNFLAATGPLGFIPLSSLTSWLIGEYGLRFSCIIGALLCALGAVLRCFATSNSYWIVILAQFLNSASGPVVMNAPPALSATWFGVNERTFATAVGTIANSVGSATGFLFGLLVHNTHQLKTLLYYEAGFSILLLVAFIVYFPSHPPRPPSATSSVKRDPMPWWGSWVQLMRESKQVLKSWNGCMILFSSGISSGTFGGWGAMLVIILAPYYSQWDIQWLGLFGIIGGVVGGLSAGKMHDHYRHFKVILTLFFFMGTLTFVAFSLATERIIKLNFLAIIALNVAAGFALGATSPVSYEALVEVTYPVKEEVSAGLLSLTNNIACFALLILGDYKTGNFINWMMAGICVSCFLAVLMMKEVYLRTTLDLSK